MPSSRAPDHPSSAPGQPRQGRLRRRTRDAPRPASGAARGTLRVSLTRPAAHSSQHQSGEQGALPHARTPPNPPCATFRTQVSLRSNDGERSAIMPRRGNSPRLRRRTGTRRDHRRGDPVPPEPSPARSARTAPESPCRGRVCRGRALAGQAGTEQGCPEPTCLIMSHATVSRTAAMLRDHVRGQRPLELKQRRCSVIMFAGVTEDRPGQGGFRVTRDRGEPAVLRGRREAFPLATFELVPSRVISVSGRTCAVLRNDAAGGV